MSASMPEDVLDPQLVAVVAAYVWPSRTDEPREQWAADAIRRDDTNRRALLYGLLVRLKAEILSERQAREQVLRAALTRAVGKIDTHCDDAETVEAFQRLLALPADTTALDAALAAARRDERRRCREAVENERLYEPNPESEGDECYDRAIRDALAAIDNLPEGSA